MSVDRYPRAEHKGTGLQPTARHLEAIFRLKHGDSARAGPAPRMRRQFGYFTPDDYYEALLSQLVRPDRSWLDVGCGRTLFPHNPPLARVLARRCPDIVGIDRDDSIDVNPHVHQKFKMSLEEFKTSRTFSIVTLRMVAEHLERPEAAAAALGRLVRAGGRLIIYTVNRWSPVSMAAWLVPFRLRHPIKRLLWNTEKADTFPTVYAMNSRQRLRRLLGAAGFRELSFAQVDDCRTFARFPLLQFIELVLWRFLKGLEIRYPESCLVGVYEKQPSGDEGRLKVENQS